MLFAPLSRPRRAATACVPLVSLLLLVMAALAPSPAVAQDVAGIYVTNQGNFSDGNGSVSFYDPDSRESRVVLDDLGSILQSLTVIDDRVYVLANTGGRVEVLDAATQQRVAQITGVVGPRYLAEVTGNKAYVTSQRFGAPSLVTVIDLTTNTVSGTVEVGGTPEGVVAIGTRAYVAKGGFGADSTVAVLDVSTDAVVDTLQVGCDGPRSLAVSPLDDLVVFCTGRTVYNDDFTEVLERTNGEIVVWDLSADTARARLPLDVQLGTAGPGQNVDYVVTREEAYLASSDAGRIYRYDDETNAVEVFLEADGADQIGAVAYDGLSEQVFVAWVPSFTAAGYVTVHTLDGTEVGRFDVGIAPAHIAGRTVLMPLAAGPEVALPAQAMLHPNYPNPFNPVTLLPVTLARPSAVTLTIHDALGRRVATLADGTLPAGEHRFRWEAAGLPSGPYLARLDAAGAVTTQRLVLLK